MVARLSAAQRPPCGPRRALRGARVPGLTACPARSQPPALWTLATRRTTTR